MARFLTPVSYNLYGAKTKDMEPTYINPIGPYSKHRDSKLRRFYLEQLRDIYWAEKKISKTLPKLTEAATGGELRNIFLQHQQETRLHVARLEQLFFLLGEVAEAMKCPAMAGILEEGDNMIQETDKGTAQRDVGLIFASQKAKHYEIASYGGLIALSSALGYPVAVSLLQQTLEEEKKTDRLLSHIAIHITNIKALEERDDV
jgi:ferritin-like metal-binding protein YciE